MRQVRLAGERRAEVNVTEGGRRRRKRGGGRGREEEGGGHVDLAVNMEVQFMCAAKEECACAGVAKDGALMTAKGVAALAH